MAAPTNVAQVVPERADHEAPFALAGADGPSIRQFWGQHPELLPVLEQVIATAPRFFGPDTRISFTVERDPEAGGHQELYVLVHTRAAPEDALNQLAAFDDQWWLDAMPAARGRVAVTLATG